MRNVAFSLPNHQCDTIPQKFDCCDELRWNWAPETRDAWLVHGFSFPNYLNELGDKPQSEIYAKSSVDLALRDAFRKMRRFLMTTKKLTEDEAISLISIGVDFGVTQVVDGNWGVHAVIKKDIFAGGES
jgi:acetamidase/formamidase